MTVAAPSGVVTFLFTDVEGSTRRWESDAQVMRAALVVHDKVLRTAIEAQGGWLFKHTGDRVCAAFASPKCAVDAAVAAQRVLELPVCRWVSRPAKPGCGECSVSNRSNLRAAPR
jgi:class 3 adenylate cyclase